MCVRRCELPWILTADQDPRVMPEYLRGPASDITGPDSSRDDLPPASAGWAQAGCPRREGEFSTVGATDGREVSET